MRACDYNVYRFKFNRQEHIRISTHGGMDSEPTGKYETKEREYLIVAPDSVLAEALFRSRNKDVDLIGVSHLGQVSDMLFLQ